MKCSQCGQEGHTLTTFVNASSMKASFICARCQAEASAKHITDWQELDRIIGEFEGLAASIEQMIKLHPEMPEVPEALASLAFTPLSMYQDLQTSLAVYKIRRMELMTLADSDERLEYELKKAIEEENYERSAEIRDQLKERAQKNRQKEP